MDKDSIIGILIIVIICMITIIGDLKENEINISQREYYICRQIPTLQGFYACIDRVQQR